MTFQGSIGGFCCVCLLILKPCFLITARGGGAKDLFDTEMLLHFCKNPCVSFCAFAAYPVGLRSRFFSENGGDGMKLSLVLRGACAAVCGCLALCRELLKAPFPPWG